MIEVGFWQKSEKEEDDSRPHPRLLQDRDWYEKNKEIAERIVAYLRYGGCVESYEMGYSFCRLDTSCPSKTMGACTLTDGIYCWPEGYLHYLEVHCVKPPPELVEHVLSRPVPERKFKKQLFMWDYEQAKPAPMPVAMQTMVLKNTTLQIDEGTPCTLS